MSHKVHPKSYRIKNTAHWNSRWLDRKNYPKILEEDFKIRDFLTEKLAKIGIEKIEIERFAGKLNIIISTSRPGLIIGRGGGGVEDLKKEIQRKVLKTQKKGELRIEIKEIKDPWSSAPLTAQSVAQQLERRIPPRRALKQTIEKVMAQKTNKGVRIEVAGRLGGSEIARREWLGQGRLPRQTLRADIDYAEEKAHCTYGVIGVKVWIYKGEVFE
jgi:small subunit ribosomal protein S3